MYTPPALARSRHVGAQELLERIAAARERALELRCRGAGELAYRPVCACGFGAAGDAREGIAEALAAFEAARAELDATLARFFEREDVRTRVRAFVDEGLAADERTHEYARGRAPLPGAEDVALFDEHLAGIELVRRVPLAELAPALGGRTFEREEAVAAFARWLERLGAGRVRFEGAEEAGGAELARWCLRQALRSGVALPDGLRGLEQAAELVGPEEVGEAARARPESLGLPRALEDRVLGWMLNGTLELPRAGLAGSAAVEALRALRSGELPRTPARLAERVARAYSAHARLDPVGGEVWRRWLDALARAPLEPEPPPLAAALRERAEDQWLVVDCLGAPLVAALGSRLAALFAPWRLAGVEHALAGETTTTDAFYRELAAAGLARRLEKLDAVDQLVHARDVPFDDLARLALAELEIGWRRFAERFDASRPLLVLADHGFRLAPGGRGYTHGGPSTLERLVPLIALVPA
jgi:hypothetical protein